MISSDEGLKGYLHEIGRHPVLTREQEVELFRQLEQGDENAREEIVRCNLKLVVSLSHQFLGRGLPLDDLIQEGNIGLLEVIKKFDYRRGFRFSTYAAFWIRQAIQQALRKQANIIRLPVRKSRMLGNLNDVISRHQNDFCREPTVEELAVAMEVSEENMQTLMKAKESVLSLDEEYGDGGTSLGDTVPALTESPVERLVCEQRQERVGDVLEHLNPRERRVVDLRYGFENGKPLSLRHTSKMTGLSQEGVRRIEQRALNKLRRPSIAVKVAGLL